MLKVVSEGKPQKRTSNKGDHNQIGTVISRYLVSVITDDAQHDTEVAIAFQKLSNVNMLLETKKKSFGQ